MKEISIIGVDLAKRVFQVHGVDAEHKTVVQKKLSRSEVLKWFEEQRPCRVSMEACATAHYWAREISVLATDIKNSPFLIVGSVRLGINLTCGSDKLRFYTAAQKSFANLFLCTLGV